MAKIKVKRKDEKGAEQEIEVEEAEILDTDVRVPEPGPGSKAQEKTLTQSEVNKLMADQRREYEAKQRQLRQEYDDYRKGIEEKEAAANKAAEAQLITLRKDLPEAITKLLDKLSPVEQLEWLKDPENVIDKKQIPPLPEPRDEPGKVRRSKVIV